MRRLLARESTSWRSELYFRSVEAREGRCQLGMVLEVTSLQTRPDEWMNAGSLFLLGVRGQVTHSLDPPEVSMEALQFLERLAAEQLLDVT